MRLVRWSVNNPTAVVSLYAGVVALSLLALWWFIPVRLMPALESPLLAVVTEVMGMPSAEVESLLSTPLERALIKVGGVRTIRSASMHGMSVVTVEFPYHYDMARAQVEVSAALQGIPLQVAPWVARPRVVRCDPLNIPVVRLAVRASGWQPDDLSRFLDVQVASRLKQVPGVDSVYTFGGQTSQIEVMADRQRLSQRGLSLLDVRRAIEAAYPARAGAALHDPISSTTLIRAADPPARKDLESVIVGRSGERSFTLADVAALRYGAERDGARYRYNGQEAVEVNVVQRADASSPRTIEAVRQVVAEMARQHPGLVFEEAYDNSHFVQTMVSNVWLELGLAVALTGLVVYLFLGDWRGTLISLATVPASLACAIVLFVPLGLSINSSTLVGLLLAIGRLVDDTIIDLHSVARHRAMGKESGQAAMDGCSEVRRAVIAATLVICLTLLPLTLAGGLTQDMFCGIIWPFMLSLAASLGVALTLTPVLAAWTYRGVKETQEPRGRRLEERYGILLTWALSHRGLVLCACASSVYLAVMLFPLIGSEMMPLADTGQIYGVLEARAGTSTEETARLSAMLEQILLRQPEVVKVSTEVGAAPPSSYFTGYGPGASNSASLMITLKDKDARKRSLWEVADAVHNEALRTIPHIRRLSLKEMGSDVMATSMAPVQLVIHGPDPLRLAWLAEGTRDIANRMTGSAMTQVSTSWGLGQRAWRLRLDRQEMSRRGLNVGAVAEQAYFALQGGPISSHLPLMLCYREDQRRTAVDMGELSLVGEKGEVVPLRQLARFEAGTGFDVIEHDNLQRCNSVMGSYRKGGPGSMRLSMDLLMASRLQLAYPQGYDIEQRGDMTQMMDSFRRLLWGLAVALVLMYLALVVQFASATVPLAIMAAIPLELPGVFLALLLAHQTFSSVSLLGIVVLSGMDVTASILLLDAALRGAGPQALVEGATLRLRPILMTVSITLIVMAPLAFFPRTGMDAYSPLATVIVGGLTMSTLLTLLIVPVFASFLLSKPRVAGME